MVPEGGNMSAKKNQIDKKDSVQKGGSCQQLNIHKNMILSWKEYLRDKVEID